jgi:predicted ATPase
MLLILDNFEHVLEAAPIASDLLAACPRLTVLVTSRSSLRLHGEHDYAVPPLDVPESRSLASLQQVNEVEAVRLYVERGQPSPAFV